MAKRITFRKGDFGDYQVTIGGVAVDFAHTKKEAQSMVKRLSKNRPKGW